MNPKSHLTPALSPASWRRGRTKRAAAAIARLFRGQSLLNFAAILTLVIPTNTFAQSLWHDEISRPMYADKRATSVGDIITIIVAETSTATKNNETKTEKKSSLSAAITSFLYPAGASGLLTKKGQLPAMAYNSDVNHDGSGSINNSETVVAKIAVRIIDVLPNHNLVVEGRRETAFSGERQTIVLHGTVRQDDVASDNTVFSYNVADASIQIIGKGTVTDSQRKGWFTRIWDKLTPF
ncbi:MAG TPA: flagellar basal body L-ring protein FlgH [Candidatus Angelobacter sp.]|nr:flagellar basal body L-ring protein FlgH [Candidatus Angelobacter sp.]